MARSKAPNQVVVAIKQLGFSRVIALCILGPAGAAFALMLTISGISRLGNPSVALALFPNDGVALGAQANLLVLSKPIDPPSAVRTLAMAALSNQAINPRALSALGFYTEVKGEFVDAEKLVRMAERLSRRDSAAQMWLLEASARRNDVKQTLVHYDQALRVRPENQLILFPRLASAIKDVEIRAALKPYIRAQNGWGEMFLADAISKNADGPALLALMIESKGLANRKANRELQASLLGRLVDNGNFSDTRRLYLSMDGAKVARLTSTAFDPIDRTGGHGPVGWQSIESVDGGGFTGSVSATNLTLEVYANPLSTSLVMRKLLFLASGKYDVVANLSRLESDPGGFLRWQVRCMQGTQGILVWNTQGIEKTIRSNFAIPANCPVQLFELIASGGQGQSGIEATITKVAVTPQR